MKDENKMNTNIELAEVTCPNKECNITFWISARALKKIRETHETIYCPHGHSFFFPGVTDLEKYRSCCTQLERKIGDLSIDRDQLKETIGQRERSIISYKGVISKIKKQRDELKEEQE